MIDSCYLFDILNGKEDFNLLQKWILGGNNEDVVPGLKRSDFALFFLNYLQEQTASILENSADIKENAAEQTDAQRKKINVSHATDKHVKTTCSPTRQPSSQSIRRVATSGFYNPIQNQVMPPLNMLGPQNQPFPIQTITTSPVYDSQFAYNMSYNENVFNMNSPKYFENGGYGYTNYNLASPLSPQVYVNSNFYTPNSPHKAEQAVSRLNYNFPSPQHNGFQTPKTSKFNRSTEGQKRTPNSSSSSSGVSILSPESPLYSENFPSMVGSNERKGRFDNQSSQSVNENQSKKQSYRKRIAPTQVKTGNSAVQEAFNSDLKPTQNNNSDKVLTRFPERKQNFFNDEKFLSNQKGLDNIRKSNVNVKLDVDKLAKSSNSDLHNCDIKAVITKSNDADLQPSVNSSRSKPNNRENKSVPKNNSKNVSNKCTKGDKVDHPDPLLVIYTDFLTKLAHIYCSLLDANLIPNITAEIYFIFSLLTVKDATSKNVSNNKINSDENKTISGSDNSVIKSSESSDSLKSDISDTTTADILTSKSDVTIKLQLFSNIHQCVYFACAVLTKQKHIIEILDKTTVKSLIDNERLMIFVPEFVDYLKNLYGKKSNRLVNSNQRRIVSDEVAINPVPFQMEFDNRDTFPADSSFHAFRKQRDSFYDILQIWNEKHDKDKWNFNQLSVRVERLFSISTDPVNMRHLARHFCDLLLQSTTHSERNTEEFTVSGMPAIDKSKLSMLTERLIRPSPGVVQKDPRPSPDFPGPQAFYHDFLVVASTHYLFHAYVINILAERINQFNSTLFQFEESNFENGQMVQEETRSAFLQCLRSLCVLAKFLGLIVFHPYQSSSELPQSVLQDDIVTRNKVLPPIDIQNYLVVARDEGRLVQTVPWVVEYLGMMDDAAPHLTYYQLVLTTLFSLYLRTSPYSNNFLTYHGQTQEVKNGDTDDKAVSKSDKQILYKLSGQTAVLLRLTIGWLFDTSNFSQSLFFNMALTYKEEISMKELSEDKWHNVTVDNSDIVDEKLLQEFCPYLGALKLRLLNNVERSQGSVRHITPISSQPSISSDTIAATTLELQLEENFFMVHSESLKRTVDFVAERVASACIKNICNNVILTLKNQVLQQKVNSKTVINLQPFIDNYYQSVQTEIENGINQRLNISLSALLGPDVVDQSVNKVCQQIAARKLQERVVNWLQSHINILDILTKLQADGNAHAEVNSSQEESKEAHNNSLQPSKALILLQDLLNDVIDSKGIAGVNSSHEIIEMLIQLKAPLRENVSNVKILLSLVLDYLILVVTYRPDVITDDVLEEFCTLWKISGDPGPLFRLFSQRNIMLLVQGCLTNPNVWIKFGRLVVAVVVHNLLSLNDLESQAIAFFRYSWPENILQSMAICLREILNNIRTHKSFCDDSKIVLMLELCSEMASCMNDELDELY